MKNGYQHIVLDDFVDKLRTMHKERTARLEALKTKEDALAYRDYVRGVVAKAFGPFPERVPLDSVVTGKIQCDGYTIEKVRFCSRPNYWVTANLYVPEGLEAPAPASLGASGHSQDGKACDTYQKFALRLVKNGFVVLMYDPIQQGERRQYDGFDYIGQANGLCSAHNVMGKQLELLGETMPSWRVWDGRVALDYLLTRPEVDPTRIGITGNSGGGTLSEWIWANEDRLAFAAPSCHITSFLTNLENELPTDAEQCPFGVIAGGLEMVDMMICQAPKPAIMLGQKYDFFERRGFIQAYRELKNFYALLGAEDKIECFMGPTGHGYSDHNQRAMVAFFRKAAGMGGEMNDVDVDSLVKKEEELYVCDGGNVVKCGSTPIYGLMSQMADRLAAKRVPPMGGEWQALITELLQLPPKPLDPPHYRVLRPQAEKKGDGYEMWARYAVETEGDIRAILRERLPDHTFGHSFNVKAEETLYLPQWSSEEDGNSFEPLIGMNGGAEVFALDVRGLGESMPEEGYGSFHQPYGMDFMFHSFGAMFNQSYLGRRVYDVLRTLDLLASEGCQSVKLVGRGQGAVIAAFVAMLSPLVKCVELHDAPKSFREWIDAKICDWPAANMPFGVLKYFDLPDLYAALGDRLKVVSNWNAIMKEG